MSSLEKASLIGFTICMFNFPALARDCNHHPCPPAIEPPQVEIVSADIDQSTKKAFDDFGDDLSRFFLADEHQRSNSK